MKKIFGAIGGAIGGACVGYPVSYFFQEPIFRAKVPFDKYLAQCVDILSHSGNPISEKALTVTLAAVVIGAVIGLFSAK